MIRKINILEAVRGGAALYVFLGHFIISLIVNKNSLFLIPFRFGQEAVILFFLMSGFVIELSHKKKPVSFLKYFKKRFFRIYPLFLIAILIVLTYNLFSNLPLSLKILVENLFMLQDVSSLKPGTIVGTYGNSALWSLSYEWWFYMIFIPVSKFKNKNFLATFIVVMSSLMYFLYPIQIFRWLMYFGIWWSGVILADLYLKENLNLKNIITAIVIPILLVPSLLLIIKIFDKPLNSIGVYPVLDVRHFISAIFFIILALIWKNINWIGYNFLKPLEKLAPFSYGLYVLHLPLILVLEPIISKYIENGFIQFIIISFLVLLISYILETKFQKKINQLLYKN